MRRFALWIAWTVLAAGPAWTATEVSLSGGLWRINSAVVNAGTAAEGLLMNARMVNATFEDRGRPGFDAEANTDLFIARISEYVALGVNAFTLNLQGGMPGYEGAVNSAFDPAGTLRPDYLRRVERVIRACDERGAVVILGLLYQRQSKILRDEAAVRAAVANGVRWVRERGFSNVVIEIANEYPHRGFVHRVIREPEGQAALIRLAKEIAPGLLVTASGYGDGKVHPEVAEACDFLTPHWNGTKVEDIPGRVAALKRFGKPIVCNEDDKIGERAVAAMKASVASGCGYGLMLKDHNQTFPFHFEGAKDDPVFYAALKAMTFGKSVTPHPDAVPNLHPPGEVDKPELVPFIVADPASLPGIVVDDTAATLVGKWQYSTHTPPYVGLGYLHDQKDGKGAKSVTFTPDLPRGGLYEVRLAHCCNSRRAGNTPVTIRHADGETTVRIDQQETPPHRRLFRTLGTFRFEAGRAGWVRVSNEGTEGKYVIADAVQWLPAPAEAR